MKRWKKIALWTLAAVTILVTGGVITLMLLVGHSQNFRRGLLAKAADSLHESTGATLEAREVRGRLRPALRPVEGLDAIVGATTKK